MEDVSLPKVVILETNPEKAKSIRDLLKTGEVDHCCCVVECVHTVHVYMGDIEQMLICSPIGALSCRLDLSRLVQEIRKMHPDLVAVFHTTENDYVQSGEVFDTVVCPKTKDKGDGTMVEARLLQTIRSFLDRELHHSAVHASQPMLAPTQATATATV